MGPQRQKVGIKIMKCNNLSNEKILLAPSDSVGGKLLWRNRETTSSFIISSNCFILNVGFLNISTSSISGGCGSEGRMLATSKWSFSFSDDVCKFTIFKSASESSKSVLNCFVCVRDTQLTKSLMSGTSWGGESWRSSRSLWIRGGGCRGKEGGNSMSGDLRSKMIYYRNATEICTVCLINFKCKLKWKQKTKLIHNDL